MDLSPLQRRTLEQYNGFRETAPTVRRWMALATRSYLRLVLIIAIGVILALAIELPSVAILLVGMVIGTISRDLGMFRRQVQIWPIVTKVLDWNRIDELLSDHESVEEGLHK